MPELAQECLCWSSHKNIYSDIYRIRTGAWARLDRLLGPVITALKSSGVVLMRVQALSYIFAGNDVKTSNLEKVNLK